MSRPRPRVPGKQNPSRMGYQSSTPPQEANSRQVVPQQLSQMQARALAARGMMGKKQMYKKGNTSQFQFVCDPNPREKDTGEEQDEDA